MVVNSPCCLVTACVMSYSFDIHMLQSIALLLCQRHIYRLLARLHIV